MDAHMKLSSNFTLREEKMIKNPLNYSPVEALT